MPIRITSCYRFHPLPLPKVAQIQSELEAFAEARGLRGICLLGAEGVNLTVSGTAADVADVKAMLVRLMGLPDLHFKDSGATKHPFHVFRVKVKDEIVTLGRPGLSPRNPHNAHLTPAEWHAALAEPDTVVIDTRNDYEVEIGKFNGALDLKIREFREFPEALRQAQIAKEKKVLIYCTGGIRCEKAILAMQEQGYDNVFQLGGGILNYLAEFPEADFAGECFVFDYRVAVDQKLQPTERYRLCPHCGQPAATALNCNQCGTATEICSACAREGQVACSKNCAHHHAIGSGSLKPHQPELRKRHKL